MSYTPQSETKLLDVKPLGSSPSTAPVFTLHREALAAVDAAAASPTKASSGMNMAGYEKAIIHVVPKTGVAATADIEVLVWSEDAGKFIPFATPKTASSPGAHLPYSYEAVVEGQIVWVRVTGTITASTVDILVAGDELDRNQ